MDLANTLSNIGFSDKQSRVYLALLQLGRASAYSVSERSGLKKPTTYVILDELIEKGAVIRVPRLRKQLFSPTPPEEIISRAEERIAKVKESLPELLSLSKDSNRSKVRSMYFEGPVGVRQALDYRMKEMNGKEIVGFYAHGDAVPKDFVSEVFDWLEEARKNKITVRGIAPEHKSLKAYRDTDAKYGRIFRSIPFEQYSSSISVEMADTFVRIISYNNFQSTIIEDEEVAKSLKEIFEMVWKKL